MSGVKNSEPYSSNSRDNRYDVIIDETRKKNKTTRRNNLQVLRRNTSMDVDYSAEAEAQKRAAREAQKRAAREAQKRAARAAGSLLHSQVGPSRGPRQQGPMVRPPARPGGSGKQTKRATGVGSSW